MTCFNSTSRRKIKDPKFKLQENLKPFSISVSTPFVHSTTKILNLNIDSKREKDLYPSNSSGLSINCQGVIRWDTTSKLSTLWLKYLQAIIFLQKYKMETSKLSSTLGTITSKGGRRKKVDLIKIKKFSMLNVQNRLKFLIFPITFSECQKIQTIFHLCWKLSTTRCLIKLKVYMLASKMPLNLKYGLKISNYV